MPGRGRDRDGGLTWDWGLAWVVTPGYTYCRVTHLSDKTGWAAFGALDSGAGRWQRVETSLDAAGTSAGTSARATGATRGRGCHVGGHSRNATTGSIRIDLRAGT